MHRLTLKKQTAGDTAKSSTDATAPHSPSNSNEVAEEGKTSTATHASINANKKGKNNNSNIPETRSGSTNVNENVNVHSSLDALPTATKSTSVCHIMSYIPALTGFSPLNQF